MGTTNTSYLQYCLHIVIPVHTYTHTANLYDDTITTNNRQQCHADVPEISLLSSIIHRRNRSLDQIRFHRCCLHFFSSRNINNLP